MKLTLLTKNSHAVTGTIRASRSKTLLLKKDLCHLLGIGTGDYLALCKNEENTRDTALYIIKVEAGKDGIEVRAMQNSVKSETLFIRLNALWEASQLVKGKQYQWELLNDKDYIGFKIIKDGK